MARRRWWVLSVWAVVLVVAAVSYPHLLRPLSASDYGVTGSDSARPLPALALAVPSQHASAGTAFTVRGHRILRDGQPWVPYGFSIYDFGNGHMAFAKYEYAKVTAEIRATAGAWHGNTVRFQVEQDAYLYGSNSQSAQVFRDKVTAAVSYAESLGLAVVINDTTEATGGIYTHNELGPTQATLTFWREVARQNDPDVILDVFNEPRWPSTQLGNWNLLFYGNSTYIGEDALIRDLRNMGYRNQLWMEATGNLALTELGVTWPKYRVSDPDSNFVYSYHHTEVDQTAVPSITGFNVQFGNLVTQRNVPVVDGEWTNRSVVPGTQDTAGTQDAAGTQDTVLEPSGDTGQCWGNAPVSVPVYLAYLQARGIGMTVWAPGPGPEHQSYDMINADGDDSTFTTANNYGNWVGCVTPASGHTSGAGQLIMNWFTQQNPA